MRGLGVVSKLLPGSRRRQGTSVRKPTRSRLELESLEERALLSANVLQTNLVSDLPGVAQVQDPHLVNPWGIAQGNGGPFWTSDNNAGVATLFNAPAANNTPFSINPLVVNIPTPVRLTGVGRFTTSGLLENGVLLAAGALKSVATPAPLSEVQKGPPLPCAMPHGLSRLGSRT